MLAVFEAKKLPNPMNYLTLANSCEKSAVTLSKLEVCGEKFGKKFENKFQLRPGLKLFVLFLREFLRDRPCPWQTTNHNKQQHHLHGDLSLRPPHAKIGLQMRLSSFPFPRRRSGSPRPLRLRAPKPEAPPSARPRCNQTHGQTFTWMGPTSHASGPARRRTFAQLVSARRD